MSLHDLIIDIKQTKVGAITLTGGEPLDQYHEVIDLLRELSPWHGYYNSNGIRPGNGYDVFLTTGYSWDIVNKCFPLISKHVDILVTDPYVEALRDRSPTWRGSTNQTIHYLTERAKAYKETPVLAEVIIENNGDATITGFSIPASIIPKDKK